jgi:hypothetical protein
MFKSLPGDLSPFAQFADRRISGGVLTPKYAVHALDERKIFEGTFSSSGTLREFKCFPGDSLGQVDKVDYW